MDFKYLIVFISLAAFASAELGPSDVPNHPDCPQTPPEPGDFPTLLPVPDQCASYYICDAAGNAIFQNCPSGLLWNPDITICDWPNNVNCTLSTSNCSPECPEDEDPDALVTLFSNPDDCGTFYMCVRCEAVLMECPEPLHFSEETGNCEWPDDAGCQ